MYNFCESATLIGRFPYPRDLRLRFTRGGSNFSRLICFQRRTKNGCNGESDGAIVCILFFSFFLHFFLFCLCRYALAWLFNIGEVAGLGQVGHRLDSCTEISRFMFSRYKPHDLFFVIIHSFDCRIRRSNCSHTSGPTRWRFVRNLIELTWNMNFFSFFFLKQKKKLV